MRRGGPKGWALCLIPGSFRKNWPGADDDPRTGGRSSSLGANRPKGLPDDLKPGRTFGAGLAIRTDPEPIPNRSRIDAEPTEPWPRPTGPCPGPANMALGPRLSAPPRPPAYPLTDPLRRHDRMTYSLRIHTFPHPTRTDNAVLRVAVYRGAINGASPPLEGPFPPPLKGLIGPLISSVSEHDLENAALGHTLPLLRSLGPSPEDRLRALANRTAAPPSNGKGDGSVGLCVHAVPSPPSHRSNGGRSGRKGCCRGALTATRAKPGPGHGPVCLGADQIRCRLGHKEMPECWEAPDPPEEGPDPIEIIRLWREGVYVTTVHG